MRQKSLALLLLQLVAAKVVLIDDIPGEEKHGGVSIDSTRNGIGHIAQKLKRMRKPSLRFGPLADGRTCRTCHYVGSPNFYQVFRENARVTYDSPPSQPYRELYPAPPPSEPFDARMDQLFRRIQKVEKENSKNELLLLEDQGKREALEISLQSVTEKKEQVELFLRVTKKELASLQANLETLRFKIKDLEDKSEYLEAKRHKIEARLGQLRFTTQSTLYNPAEYRKQFRALKEQYEDIKNSYSNTSERIEYVYPLPSIRRIGPNKDI